ncbi:MAG: NAD-dependent epimerase/dehydratase family protein, partial [Proteobacteria bacterium]|nr:NAD-dependent epimerase/dehydratase family protein [Pseudomonadota bacterium]
MRRVIVTGGQGFIARHLVAHLHGNGTDVLTIGRRPSSAARHVTLGSDTWDVAQLASHISDFAPDAIFHLAGTVDASPAVLERLNVGLAQTLMQAIRRSGRRPKLIIAGSAAEYGSAILDGVAIAEDATCAPLTTYGASKLAQTRAGQKFAAETGMPV